MNTIDTLIQESESYLVSAALAMKPYKEVSDYASIFESGNPEIIAQEEANEKATEKSQNFLSKSFEAIKKAIKTLIAKIKDFIDRLTLSTTDRIGLKKMEEMIRQNPEFANKKITVKEYKKILAMTDQKLKEVEEKIREVKANEKTPIEATVEDVKKFLAGNLAGVGTTVACDTALKMAASDVDIARNISRLLDYELIKISDLEKQIGKKEAKHFAKEIHALSKEGILRNLRVKLFHNQFGCVSDAVKQSFKELAACAALGVGHKGKALKDNEYTSKTIKATKKGVFSAAGSVIKGAVSGAKDGVSAGKQKARRNAEKAGRKAAADDVLARESAINDYLDITESDSMYTEAGYSKTMTNKYESGSKKLLNCIVEAERLRSEDKFKESIAKCNEGIKLANELKTQIRKEKEPSGIFKNLRGMFSKVCNSGSNKSLNSNKRKVDRRVSNVASTADTLRVNGQTVRVNGSGITSERNISVSSVSSSPVDKNRPMIIKGIIQLFDGAISDLEEIRRVARSENKEKIGNLYNI